MYCHLVEMNNKCILANKEASGGRGGGDFLARIASMSLKGQICN